MIYSAQNKAKILTNYSYQYSVSIAYKIKNKKITRLTWNIYGENVKSLLLPNRTWND